MSERRTAEFAGTEISYLTAGSGPGVLLLHGTFWSRVWEPVLEAIADTGHTALAPDFPGFGASGGELSPETASVPALAEWAHRFAVARLDAPPVAVIGHDIGGGVAQHLAAGHGETIATLGLVNSVLYDSWPVPAVARFQDRRVREATGPDELLEARAQSLTGALAADPGDAEREAWLAPWRSPARVRSWTAMAAAADPRYTLAPMDRLRGTPERIGLVWGTEDAFQPLAFAERFVADIPRATLTRIDGARHIPTHDDPGRTGAALAELLGSRP